MTTPSASTELNREFDHEELVMVKDSATGLVGCVAIHSTALGPAVGGLRLSSYPGISAAATDALRLSRAMTFKNAAAGLDLGGGKAVLIDDGRWSDPTMRTARLHAFAVRLDRLDGRYITAEDVGTTPLDMETIADITPHVSGRPAASGDPSAATARTVFAAIATAVELTLNTDLDAVRVGVLGAGHVGGRLVRLLRQAGAEVILSDIDTQRALDVANDTGARAVPLAGFVTQPMDVFAPCALGGVLRAEDVPQLRCRVIAGAANNPLADPAVAATLDARGILYVPDFLANNGGIINVAAEVLDFDAAELNLRIDDAIGRTRAVLTDARDSGRTPLELALELVGRRLEQARISELSGTR